MVEQQLSSNETTWRLVEGRAGGSSIKFWPACLLKVWALGGRRCGKEGVMMKEATRPEGSQHAVRRYQLRTQACQAPKHHTWTQPHTNQPERPASCQWQPDLPGQPARPACATQTPHATPLPIRRTTVWYRMHAAAIAPFSISMATMCIMFCRRAANDMPSANHHHRLPTTDQRPPTTNPLTSAPDGLSARPGEYPIPRTR